MLSGNVVSDISDHFSQFCLLPAYKLQFSLTAICREYRDFSSFSDDSFLNDLEQIDWDSIDHSNRDINKSFSTFSHKTLRVLNKHAPTKIPSRRKAKQQLKPWITKGIRRSISLKNQFYHSGENQKYKLYRNKISTLTRLSKKLYFHNFFSRNLHNTKKTWKGINDLIGRRKKPKQTITSIRAPNNKRVISDAQDIWPRGRHIQNLIFVHTSKGCRPQIQTLSSSIQLYLQKLVMRSFPYHTIKLTDYTHSQFEY